jgi:hypothetical protein
MVASRQKMNEYSFSFLSTPRASVKKKFEVWASELFPAVRGRFNSDTDFFTAFAAWIQGIPK